MKYTHFPRNVSSEDLDKVADIYVIKDFDILALHHPSAEFRSLATSENIPHELREWVQRLLELTGEFKDSE